MSGFAVDRPETLKLMAGSIGAIRRRDISRYLAAFNNAAEGGDVRKVGIFGKNGGPLPRLLLHPKEGGVWWKKVGVRPNRYVPLNKP